MASDSARLRLPLLDPGQAQKEWFHNEALALLDMAVQACVEGVADVPPADAAVGACWIVGPGAGGPWSGQVGAIAGLTAGGWRFVVPREGFAAWSRADGTTLRWRDAQWRLDRSPPIAAPSGGAVVDAECRAALQQVLAALTARGWLA